MCISSSNYPFISLVKLELLMIGFDHWYSLAVVIYFILFRPKIQFLKNISGIVFHFHLHNIYFQSLRRGGEYAAVALLAA